IINGLLHFQHSSFYILALQTLLVDFAFIAIHLFFWIPIAINPNFLSLNGADITILHLADCIGTYAWFHNALGHVFIAWNRFAVLVFSEHSIFTRQRVIVMAVVHHILAALITVLTQFVIPCCRLSFNFSIFSYINVPNGDMANYSDTFLTVPVNTLSTATSLVCYTTIFISVRRARQSEFQRGDELTRQRKREYRYALQFASLASVFSFCWISFRIFPIFIPLSDPSLVWVFGLTTVTTMTNCFMNALVYLLNNSEVRLEILNINCFSMLT
ncbi:hypothetical protein PENTCL1PPCAC_15902, partial [Pristionchus entomophagus]